MAYDSPNETHRQKLDFWMGIGRSAPSGSSVGPLVFLRSFIRNAGTHTLAEFFHIDGSRGATGPDGYSDRLRDRDLCERGALRGHGAPELAPSEAHRREPPLPTVMNSKASPL